jgi:hypothetical protein
MYCSACGVDVAQGLSYCKNCGAKLTGAKADAVTKPSEVKPELLVSAMVGGFVAGLVAIAILIGVLKRVAGFDLPILLAVTAFSFVLMLMIEGVLISLLLNGRKRAREMGDAEPPNNQQTRELAEAQARALPEPLPSVTEHTTRAFEPIYTERTSK